VHASLLVASSADTTCGGLRTCDTRGRGPSGVSLALIRSQTPTWAGGKRRQLGSHPSDFAGRAGPHKVPFRDDSAAHSGGPSSVARRPLNLGHRSKVVPHDRDWVMASPASPAPASKPTNGRGVEAVPRLGLVRETDGGTAAS